MSESGLQARGRSNSLKDNENQYNIYAYCGGGGAGGAPIPRGVSGIVLEYKVSKYITGNRKIVLENNPFRGVVMSTDGISDNANCYIGLSDVATDPLEATAKAGGIVFQGYDELGAAYEFDVAHVPQPFLKSGGSNPDWSAKVYVYLWWGNPGYYNLVGTDAFGTIDETCFRIIKHDNDMRI